MGCQTGQLASITSANTSLKFSSTLYKVTRISGLARSVVVIDNSDLSIPSGYQKKYCFGDVHDLSPITVDCHFDPDNVTIIPNGANTAGIVPLPLGLESGTNVDTNATNEFVLTLPTGGTVATNVAQLTFSGAVISDSGVELVNNDRLRVTYQIQPDGEHFSWDGNDS